MDRQQFGPLGIESRTRGVAELLRNAQKPLFASFLIRLSLMMLSVVWILLWSTPALPALATDYNKESLAGADFSGRVLTDASFNQADLRESNFSGADLRGVSLFGAQLESANLEGADL
ncbi:MAG: pentapeptide repeat-containing protein, partial [Leptolyngbyaceae cyanobacterium RU_5_1]|nr:pentapeptide repeat-containing protein [Leptolyngbyaceae cyanobacterium RU_5_1]